MHPIQVEQFASANPHGAEVRSDGQVRFRLWAPACRQVQLALASEAIPMLPTDGGWHELITDRARPGTRYHYLLPDGMRVPDPASRYQPEDVHGPSEVVDLRAFPAQDASWTGRPWSEAVLYELHLGAFTPPGTFRAAIDRLDYLADLGITALELMPIGDFPGLRSWGYDGVLPYATDSSYGRPEDFRAFVEAAHARGIMVLLDVVYNHFGPEGNYLALFAPSFFTERHHTPWGAALNFDGPDSRAVRDFVVHNALYWVRDLRVDGLRLDAVHAILDDSEVHILQEIAERVRAETPGRHVHLILENEENEARWLNPRHYTAQWNDDVHHVLHTAVTREGHAYYAAYIGDTARLGRALAEGFAFQGEMMDYRGRERGEACAHLPPSAFIAFLQNHDQVGNRAFGDRITAKASPPAVRAAAAIYLLLPQIPMLFMGEEFGAATPFPFFCDFADELGEAVREGRRREFARFPEFQEAAARERIPDPQSEQTFAAAKLDWNAVDEPWLDWYRRILRCRRESIIPLIDRIPRGGTFEILGTGAVLVRWGGHLVLAANLSPEPVSGFPPPGHLIWQEGATTDDGRTLQLTLKAWTVSWWTEAA